jgi:hypothetical protein
MRQLPRKLFPFFGFVFSFSFLPSGFGVIWSRGTAWIWDGRLRGQAFLSFFCGVPPCSLYMNCMISGLYSFTGDIMVHLFQGYDTFYDVDIL